MQERCRVFRTYDSTPTSTLELFCGKCGFKVGTTAGADVDFTMTCSHCGCSLDADSMLARPVGDVFEQQIDDDERVNVLSCYFDQLVEIDGKAGREKAQDLASRLDVEWSVYDPLFRRRVDDISTTSKGSDVKRTQWIYTDADNDDNPHLYHSELGFYYYRGFVPFWAQEDVALSSGLDGHPQLSSYYIVKREQEYLEAKGVDVDIDDPDFLEWVCERHNLKFDPLEVRHNIRLVEDNLETIEANEEAAREKFVRDMVFQYYKKNGFTLDACDGKEVQIDKVQDVLSFLDDEKEAEVREELDEKNILWMLDHEQSDWFDARYSPSFPSLEKARAWVDLLQDRFEDEWEATLEEARETVESSANQSADQPLNA